MIASFFYDVTVARKKISANRLCLLFLCLSIQPLLSMQEEKRQQKVDLIEPALIGLSITGTLFLLMQTKTPPPPEHPAAQILRALAEIQLPPMVNCTIAIGNMEQFQWDQKINTAPAAPSAPWLKRPQLFLLGLSASWIALGTRLLYCLTYIYSSTCWGAFDGEIAFVDLAAQDRSALIKRILEKNDRELSNIPPAERLQQFFQLIDGEIKVLNTFLWYRHYLKKLHIAWAFPGNEGCDKKAEKRIERLQFFKKIMSK